MFSKRNPNILDKVEVKGLIGELLVLEKYIIPKWGEKVAIISWMGPLLGHKDFEIEDTWYEVKSVNENALQIMISSLEQLESDIDGHMVIVRLEESNSVVKNTYNLNDLVISIAEKISNPENMDIFRSKLEKVGYMFNEEYNEFYFSLKGIQKYIITEDFPRLRRSKINQYIGNVKYSILIDGISGFKEE